MLRPILTIFSFLICLSITGQAFAATYAIAPFKVNGGSGYSYLQTAIPPMFNSRLFLAGTNEPVSKQDALTRQNPVESKAAAEKLRKEYGADYLVYGSITMIGNNASLDVNVVGANSEWQKATQNNVNNLFNSVQIVADSINSEIFGRTVSQQAPTANRAPINNAIISNEVAPQHDTSYLNPELRYQGAESQRTRTRPLDYASYGFEIADYNNDGRTDVAILSRSAINIYQYNDNDLNLLATYKIPTSYEPVRIRAFEQDGETYLVFAAHETSTNSSNSLILKMTGSKIERVARSNYYLSVERVTPYDAPILIGQAHDKTRFVRGAVYQMRFNGSNVSRGGSISLPKEANVFNFTWLPGNANVGGNHLLVVDKDDKVIVFNEKNKRMFKTEEIFASTGVGVKRTRDITGFASVEGSQDVLYYYMPMRILVSDLDNNGQYEAITAKPVSTAAVLLNNYRTYSQGEVHGQIWDGIGLSLLWKTRRIKGTIVDVDIADPNNDGVTDLVVNVNTYPGTLGFSSIKNMIVLYPLDTSNIDSNAVNYSE